MMINIIRKLFLAKEIKSKSGILHFQRWRILSTPWFDINIHRIFRPDEDEYLHDHPWNYFGMILAGSYDEQYSDAMFTGMNPMNPGSFGFNNAERFHKIYRLNTPSVTTLFINGRRRRDWGYKVDFLWVQHEMYRKNKDKMKVLLLQYCDGDYADNTKDVRFLKQTKINQTK